MPTALTVNFTDDEYDVIDEAAWDHRMNKNELMRAAVNEYLQRSDEGEYMEIEVRR